MRRMVCLALCLAATLMLWQGEPAHAAAAGDQRRDSVDDTAGRRVDCCLEQPFSIAVAVEQWEAAIDEVARKLRRRLFRRQVDDHTDAMIMHGPDVTGVAGRADEEAFTFHASE